MEIKSINQRRCDNFLKLRGCRSSFNCESFNKWKAIHSTHTLLSVCLKSMVCAPSRFPFLHLAHFCHLISGRFTKPRLIWSVHFELTVTALMLKEARVLSPRTWRSFGKHKFTMRLMSHVNTDIFLMIQTELIWNVTCWCFRLVFKIPPAAAGFERKRCISNDSLLSWGVTTVIDFVG